MTPFDIAGMAKVNGLDAVALTDHNTCLNLPAFFHACNSYGITPIAGMELCTAEEIHLICLFPLLESALDFSSFVEKTLLNIKNKPDIFGHQIIYSTNETDIYECDLLLSSASSLTLSEAFYKVNSYGGICYPAHIDRQSFSVTSVLGIFPDEPPFKYFELSNADNLINISTKHQKIKTMRNLFGSDSHCLSKFGDAFGCFILDDNLPWPLKSESIINSLL